MSDVITFRVWGEPQPFPKKRSSRRTGMIYTHDPGGVKRGWMEAVAHTGRKAMTKAGLNCWGDKVAVAMALIFYRTKPASATKKVVYPLTKPDLDNYEYAISNALIGIVYHDDSRVVDMALSKRWADADHAPGVEVTVKKLT